MDWSIFLTVLLINAISLLRSICHSKDWNHMWATMQHLFYNSFTETLLWNVSLLFWALWQHLWHFHCVAGSNGQNPFFVQRYSMCSVKIKTLNIKHKRMRLTRISNSITGLNKLRLHDWFTIINTLERLLLRVRSAEALPGQDEGWLVLSEWIINSFLFFFFFLFFPRWKFWENKLANRQVSSGASVSKDTRTVSALI